MRAAENLGNMAALIDAATTTDERRALMRTLFESLYIEHVTIKTITPTVIYLPLIGAMRELAFPEYGVADGRQKRTSHILALPLWPRLPAAEPAG